MKDPFAGACILLCVMVASQGLSAQRRTWVVAPQPGPGVDFTSLRLAAPAARPGDLILVRDGHYVEWPFTISQGISIVAEHALQATLESNLRIQGVPAGQALCVQGLRIWGPATGALDPVACRVIQCAGTVSFQGCSFQHGSAASLQVVQTYYFEGAVAVYSSSCVVLEDCRVEPGYSGRQAVTVDSTMSPSQLSIVRGQYYAGPTIANSNVYPAAGLNLIGASVFIDDVEIYGGQTAGTGAEQRGGSALFLGQCTAWVKGPRRGTIVGGDAGGFVVRFPGGDGLHATMSDIYLDGSPFRGGLGTPTNPVGDPGMAINSDRPAVPRPQSRLVRSPVAWPQGGTTTLDLTSGPGEPHWLLMSSVLRPSVTTPPQANPFWLVQGPGWFVLDLFFTDATGRHATVVPIPNLPELTGAQAWIQDYGVLPNLSVITSAPVGGVIR